MIQEMVVDNVIEHLEKHLGLMELDAMLLVLEVVLNMLMQHGVVVKPVVVILNILMMQPLDVTLVLEPVLNIY